MKESLAQSRLAFPDDEVLQLARQAIVRLQVAYHLNSTYLITTANANLTDYDVGSLAMVAQSAGFTAVAEDWKRLAATSVATDAASSDVGSQVRSLRMQGQIIRYLLQVSFVTRQNVVYGYWHEPTFRSC